MHWSCKYIGLLYSDYNCAEFIKLIIKKELGVDLILPQDLPNRIDKQSQLINNKVYEYIELNSDEKNKDFDLVLMSARRRFCHIGLFVIINNESYVLHSIGTKTRSCLHRIKDLNLHSISCEGVYKWKSYTGTDR